MSNSISASNGTLVPAGSNATDTNSTTISSNGTITNTSSVSSDATTNGVSVAVPAALGALLGIAIVAALVAIVLLVRKSKLLRQINATQAASEIDDSDYRLDAAGKTSDDETAQLRQQLARVRAELAAVSVLAPSTIRDHSDYARDLALLNDNVRQTAMRMNRTHPSMSAATLREALCRVLNACVFDRFDPTLDDAIDCQLSAILANFDRPGSAILWKAMAVQSLPLANATAVATIVDTKLAATTGLAVSSGGTLGVVGLAIQLARDVAQDGKGYTVAHARGSPTLELVSLADNPAPLANSVEAV